MKLIYESNNYNVVVPSEPHIDRGEGGHIIIRPKGDPTDRQHLSAKQAIELMRLTIVVGRSMTAAMRSNGVNIGRINYQDNGNWNVHQASYPVLHVHIYGRAKDAKIQKYGQACFFPDRDANPDFYLNLRSLEPRDVVAIQQQISELFKTTEFSDDEWGL